MPIEDRFWSKVNKTDTCWIWVGARKSGKFNYGKIGAGGAKNGWRRAHIVAWELTRGLVPHGLYVLHNCDNPPCVNPHHLRLGTLKDNSRDMVERNRNPALLKKGNQIVQVRWAKYRDCKR